MSSSSFLQPSTETPAYLIQNGDVYDGSGAPARKVDVRVRGETIAEIGPSLTPLPGETVLDAAMLSRLFRAEVQLTCEHGRYLSHLRPRRGRKM